nr:DUF1848 domain-containing protein [uncultured Bacteroides sp.]
MNKIKKEIVLENGDKVLAQTPIIISASRSTDIPAFYCDWFFHRLDVGYSAWKNPFNGVKSYVSYQETRLIVFWSKNPRPLLNYLDKLKEKNINCYIQFTLNDYVKEGLEKGVPSLENRIETFIDLVSKLGKGKVIWRFDPLILTDQITVDELLLKAKNIGDRLSGYTEKMVFSFADIENYNKVKNNLKRNNINYCEFKTEDMYRFSKGISEFNKKWGYELATCGEKIDLDCFGVKHNKCIDDNLILNLFSEDYILMDSLGFKRNLFGEFEKIKDNKDKGQRQSCGCVVSKDIGEYNTCPHLCEYCYANTSKEIALANYKRIKSNTNLSETIKGE